MNREQPIGVSKKTNKGIFKPWPPKSEFRHMMEKSNFMEITLSDNGPKEIAAIKAKAKAAKGESIEITH